MPMSSVPPGENGEMDWRWGFEPEAWVGLRSRRMLGRQPGPNAIAADPAAPSHAFLPRLMSALRAVPEALTFRR